MEAKKEQTQLRILLIEDDPHDRELFRSALEDSDVPYVITECIEAEEAIGIIESTETPFDLVVSDYNLPGMSGLQLFKEVDEDQRSFPFVLLTGAGSENRAILALKSGVDDYLVKDASHRYVERLPLVLRQIVRKHSERAAQKISGQAAHESLATLEAQVQQRTAELHKANVALREQLAQRKEIEQELLRSEAKYRSLCEQASEGLLQTTTQGGLLTANSALAHILGYSTGDELINAVSDVGAQICEDAQTYREMLRQLEGQATVCHQQMRLRRKDGTVFVGEMRLRAVRDTSGAVQYYEGTVVEPGEKSGHLPGTAEVIFRVQDELRAPLQAISSVLGSLHRQYLSSLPQGAQPLVVTAVRQSSQALRTLDTLQQSTSKRGGDT